MINSPDDVRHVQRELVERCERIILDRNQHQARLAQSDGLEHQRALGRERRYQLLVAVLGTAGRAKGAQPSTQTRLARAGSASALAACTRVALCASVAIVARCAVGPGPMAADPGRKLANI